MTACILCSRALVSLYHDLDLSDLDFVQVHQYLTRCRHQCHRHWRMTIDFQTTVLLTLLLVCAHHLHHLSLMSHYLVILIIDVMKFVNINHFLCSR